MDKDIAVEAVSNEFCLSGDNLAYINKEYKAFSRVPSDTELEIFRRIFEERSGFSEGYCFSSIITEDTSVRETFDDLCAKLRVIRGEDAFPMSFEEGASVLSDYVEMIGRGDESLRLADGAVSTECSVFDSRGKAVFTFDKPKRGKKSGKKNVIPYDSAAIVYLHATDEAEEKGGLSSLFADDGFKNLGKMLIEIGEYGIIGVFCRCDFICGIKADMSRLPNGCADADVLVSGSRGGYILITPKRNLSPLEFLAGQYGISPIYFAYPTVSGLIEGNVNAPFIIPIKAARGVIGGMKEVAPAVGGADASFVWSGICGAELNGRLVASSEISGDFYSVVDRVVSLILTLVSRGIDRRGVCLSFDYRLAKKTSNSECTVGDALALLLGVYRVGIELATPVGVTSVEYGDGGNSLFCGAYAVKPVFAVDNSLELDGGDVYFMPVARRSDGLVDFYDLRRVCDEFSALVTKGAVLRSAAVTVDGLGRATEEISSDCNIFTDGKVEALMGAKTLGILFVCKGDATGTHMARIEKKEIFS